MSKKVLNKGENLATLFLKSKRSSFTLKDYEFTSGGYVIPICMLTPRILDELNIEATRSRKHYFDYDKNSTVYENLEHSSAKLMGYFVNNFDISSAVPISLINEKALSRSSTISTVVINWDNDKDNWYYTDSFNIELIELVKYIM